MKQKKCSICHGSIEVHRHPETGAVIWADGNNAEPVNGGRCCDKCNLSHVLAARLAARQRGAETVAGWL